MDAIAKVLTDLYCTDEQVEQAVSDLASLLYDRKADNWEAMRREAFSSGVVRALLGILRSSSSVPLITLATGCIGLIAHDSDDSREAFSHTDVMSILISLLTPRAISDKDLNLVWQKEWIPVYEKALIALRKLTYHNLDNQQLLVQQGGIKLMVGLCTDKTFFKSSCQFSSQPKELLLDLALGKKLFCQAVAAPKDYQASILRSFPVLTQASPSLSVHYPAYIVNLATEEKVWIADMMIAAGIVWPDCTPFPPATKPVITCVMVSHVEDGGHVWCQFCSEKPHPRIQAMCTSLQKLLYPSPPTSTQTFAVGDVYAAFVDPATSHDPCGCLVIPQWCRARLLGQEPSGDLRVFSVDFGFTAIVPQSHLVPIPIECRGVPPQAVPCKLKGVMPVPSAIAVLENCAAVLRNLAFEKDAFRREIKTFRGIEALLEARAIPYKELSQGLHISTAQQALGALLNLAVSMEMRQEMGKRGAIETILSICRQCRDEGDSDDLLISCLGCLQNMVLLCPDNVAQLKKLEGHNDLIGMLASGQYDDRVESRLLAVLHNLAGSDPGGVEALFRGVSDFSLSCSSGRDTEPRERRRLFKRVPRYQEKCRVNGERVHANPIYRCMEPGAVGGASSSEGETTDGEMLVESDGEECSVPEASEISGSVSAKFYMLDSHLPYCEDGTHQFMDVADIYSISKKRLKRSICAMANTCKASSIYIGVRRSGAVRGIKTDRRQRDLLLVEIDNIMREFSPTIKHNRYKVLFTPLAYCVPGQSPVVTKDYHVVQLDLCESPSREVYTVTERMRFGEKAGEIFERCYYRIGNRDEALSMQELRDTVAREESRKYAEEVTRLQHRITELKLRQQESMT